MIQPLPCTWRRNRALWALAVASVLASGCTVESECTAEAPPRCASEAAALRCEAGFEVEVACGDTQRCVDGLGCTACSPGALSCSEDRTTTLVCRADGSGTDPDAACAGTDECVTGLGCRSCIPMSTQCDGDTLTRCLADGTGTEVVAVCDAGAGEVCRDGASACIPAERLCEVVGAERSNVGCDFWPAPLASCGAPIDDSFALLLGNPFEVPATVTFERGGNPSRPDAILPPLSTLLVHLPCVATPRVEGVYTYSAIRPSGAYRVRSSTPITMAQIQPTEDPTVMPDDFLQLGDAALSMPSSALDCSPESPCEFYAMSSTTWLSNQGSLAVVSTDDRPVNVTIRLSAPITPSIDGFTGRPGTVPLAFEGEELRFTLAPGDVLELMSAVPASGYFYDLFFDFTGTRIVADGRVNVVSGSLIAFVPVGTSRPNALAETIPPVSTWGTEHVIARPRALAGEPYVVKVLASERDTDVSFDPPIYPTRRLAAGEHFELFAESDLVVTATRPVLVAQLTVGSGLYETGSDAEPRGGPALAIVPSIERGSRDVSFATMASVSSVLSVATAAGAEVFLDGRRLGTASMEGERYATARVSVGAGMHRLRSTEPVQAWLQGVGFNGSFLLPIELTMPRGIE